LSAANSSLFAARSALPSVVIGIIESVRPSVSHVVIT